MDFVILVISWTSPLKKQISPLRLQDSAALDGAVLYILLGDSKRQWCLDYPS